MTKRIYLVADTRDNEEHLVRASSRTAARSRIAEDRLKVEVASQEKIVELIQSGATVIDCGENYAADQVELPV